MDSVFNLTNSHELRIVGKGGRGPEHGAQNMPSRFCTAQHPAIYHTQAYHAHKVGIAYGTVEITGVR